jgi:GNAT superfamily N-acetyltransferase
VSNLTPEDFRGDYEQLAAVMRTSWAGAANASYLYTPDFLAECFRYPGVTFALAPAIYAGAELIAFAAGLPRHVTINGTSRRVIIATFVTVAEAHKGSGYGTAIWSELVRRSAAAGYDAVVTYCEAGEKMQRIVERCSRALDFPHVLLKSFSYLVRTMPTTAAGASEVGTRPSAQALMSAAAAQLAHEPPAGADTMSLHRAWTEPEAAWQLSRLGAVAVTGGGAVLGGTVATVDDPARSRVLVVEDILWGQLEGAARHILLAQLLDQAAGEGARHAVVPLLGYADVRPFLTAGFLPAPHTMNANLTLWCDPDAARPAKSFYLDVI